MSTVKRKWAPKTRGGCSTCKSRHIRCDKLEPCCTPCQKSSRNCAYTSNSELDPLKVVLFRHRPITPFPNRISESPSQTNVEARAFDFFRTKVAGNLSGVFDPSFWTVDILQVAQQEEPIRHAVVALASLSEHLLDDPKNGLETLPRLALYQHTEAISKLKQKMHAENDASIQIVLMTCAIFVCFEMFQSNFEAALVHMTNGVYVFYNWVSNDTCSTRHPREFTAQLEAIFGRLMLQIILFIDTKPHEWKFINPAFTPALPLVTPMFRSVDEARDCLDRCTCSLYHRMISSQFRELEEHEVDTNPLSQLTTNPLDEWEMSFESFMTKESGNLSPREQKVAVLLEIQHITATILGTAGPSSEETIFDCFEEEFSRIIELAYLLTADASEEQRSPIPTFDMGILPHLYFVASRCRHPLLRRKALELLRRGPRQEGIWSRDMLAGIGERIMGMEEKLCGSVESSMDIKASARLTVINASIDSTRGTVVLHCCRQEAGGCGVRDVIHELVAY
ncbi:hypothetical protein NA56DRAFT_756235 [Hyaloscypha hepaticicola]|uniref:Zn(2)-C6 fungal-type domain-containing protein n=1 Tax=Hyaloscypha hepaticicola TaxID=2082293 RepID=A0A2J6PFP7_9HELO|nr:hypothetical protein NA56DRAFT_756235 [Hyaloscypha hepaticicola]